MDGLDPLSLRYSGDYLHYGHYQAPNESRSYPIELDLYYSSSVDSGRVDTTVDGTQSSTFCNRAKQRTIVSGRSDPADDDGPRSRHCYSLTDLVPSLLLLHAQERGHTLRWLEEAELRGTLADIIEYSTEAGKVVTLYISRDAHRLLQIESITPYQQTPDSAERVIFSDYVARGGILPPTAIAKRELEASAHAEISVTLQDLQDPPAEPTRVLELLVPPGSDESWALSVDDGSAQVVSLAPDLPDLLLVELPEEDFRAPVFLFDEYSVVVDAPLNSRAGEQILRAIESAAPDRPVAYVIVSHHHPHHIGGVRPFVHAGATIVVTEGNVAAVEELVARPYEIAPDRLAREPRAPKLLVVHDKATIEDAHHRLDLYDIGPSTQHTDEYLLVYDRAKKLLIEGDLAYFPDTGEVLPARPRTKGLWRSIGALGLDVRWIVQPWPLHGHKRLISVKALEQMIEAADKDR